MLISDEGFDGMIIRPSLNSISHTNYRDNQALVCAQTNVSMDALIEYCLAHTILGLEEFSGIPGTVGGSVYINLHYFQFLLSHFLVSALVLEKATGTLLTVDTSWFNFGYNYSTLHNEHYYLVEATFLLKKVQKKKLRMHKGGAVKLFDIEQVVTRTKTPAAAFLETFMIMKSPS